MKRKDHNNNLILELKILENRTENIQTCKRLQKSGIKKKITAAKSSSWSGRINSYLHQATENASINRSNHRKKLPTKKL